MQYRKLQDGDLHALDAFLATHAETSMVLRSNLRKIGMNRRHHPLSGCYYGEVSADGAVTAVLTIFGNGKVFVQTGGKPVPRGLIELFRAENTQAVAGFFGPADQAQDVIDLLGFGNAQFAINACDAFYRLDLANLILPQNVRSDSFQMVDAERIDRNTLLRWLRAYEIEALGGEDTPALDSRIASRLVHALNDRNMWALVVDGVAVSLSGFNAELPDMVQIGPVWTPPEHRSNGYARILVAKTLLAARARGVTHAVLSTDSPAAAKAYEAIGFERDGAYRLALLASPVKLIEELSCQ
ncbi:GNAT family N-acetyltransferase [Thalassospira xiamenensis]|uniref:Acetyltransferase (GNAT) family protein n=1 Tax=Thalassospira xiamenensis TaxID=220697 RepID=A0A285RLC3_9PROT|nr:GNAT family N-acetyltransferase [Thalassospira xiamenensis]SOB93127.1 Acetyltransferase (GNAT) family protein [Thalassospira xiamenensis]